MTKMKYKYISQIDERDCGVAALSMVLNSYNTDYSLAKLRLLAKTTAEGTTALGIVRAAQRLGFETKAVRADMTIFEMADVPYPFIVHVITQEKYLHYYTVFKNMGDSILLGDPNPSVGLTKMSKQQFEHEWDGVSIFLTPTSAYKPKKENNQSILSLLPLVFHQKRLIVQVMLASLLTTIISVIGSYFFEGLIDNYIPGGFRNTLDIIAIGLIAAYMLQGVFQYAEQYMLTVISQRLTIDIILGYIKHIFELPMSFFSTRQTGEITSRFTDANQIITALASTIISFFLDLGILITVGIILGFQNWHLFLLTLICIPVYAVIILAFVNSFDRLNQNAMQSNAMLSSDVIEAINGIETIKAINGEKKVYENIDQEFVHFLEYSFKYSKLSIQQEAMKSVFQLLLNILVLWYGAVLVMDDQITVGQLITYNALLTYFTNPIESIIGLQTKIQSAKVAHRRLNEVYLVESEFKKNDGLWLVDDVSKFALKPMVLAQIKFRYGFGDYVIDDVSMTIDPGQKIALVGASGSGKSTLIKLLIRFLEPEKGRVMYGNDDIKNIDRRKLRATITYIPQNPYIFTGSIEKNILLANPTASHKQVVEAMRLAEISDEVNKMPLGLQTEISQDSKLSGGQKQRIAIARGIVTESPVLILDESTSHLDVITERKLVRHLLGLKHKTIIFVAHRLTIAEQADTVYVMDQGKIVQSGTDKDLRKQIHGKYASFFK